MREKTGLAVMFCTVPELFSVNTALLPLTRIVCSPLEGVVAFMVIEPVAALVSVDVPVMK